MKNIFIFLLVFIFSATLTLAAGEFGAGTFNDGAFGFGTPAPIVQSSPSSSGGGGGGGGGGYYELPKKEVIIDGQTTEISLIQGDSYKITFKNNEFHNLTLDKLYSDRTDISIFSERQAATLYLGKNKLFIFDNLQLLVTLKNIIGGSATFTIKDITEYSNKEKIEPPSISNQEMKRKKQLLQLLDELKEQETKKAEELTKQQQESQKSKFKFVSLLVWLLSIIILIIALIFYYFNIHYKKEKT